jgi:hypothetical protein
LQTVVGALAGDADRDQETEQNALDRQHQQTTTAATLANQQSLARMKPRLQP